ncbi:enoyl-CoA hydratase [Thalassotalea sp. PLHSN55]|uniref:enoyl-CoA hydratase n=1 Tax=Thalassotalea sp. PLHSN55 TaxID=3435888 RepID=UPI003F86DCA8
MNNLILTNEDQGVFTVTINRFDKKNALNSSMYLQLCDAFEYANTSESVRCLLIQGNNECFCAGNDLQDFLENSDDIVALKFIKKLAEFNKPLIAAVAGVAVGIGTTLLLHCDMVIAADNSKFKLPFTQLGLCPEAGSSYLLTQRLGYNKAFELLVLGELFFAEDAKNYGIVNQVTAKDDVIATATKIAQTIAKLPADAVSTSRSLIRQASDETLKMMMASEAEEFIRLVNTPDCKAILTSFFK